MHDFHHRRKAVGGAGGGGDDVMSGRIVQLMIHAIDDVQGRVGDRGRNQDFPDTLVEVGLQGVFRLEFARALNDQIHVFAGPVHLCRCCQTAEIDFASIHRDGIIAGGDLVIPVPMHRIEFEQMCVAMCIAADFIDMYDFVSRIVPTGAKAQFPHAAKAVDAHPDAHLLYPLTEK